ncbi:type II toxin-antitoxin system RelE/ParE family toxin [Kovacikia minuta CCNUW1]|uniref:type II toxin-antitoxin system RelE family toxin n=1 Tax=Kovacikia minuta TaxID=2931930 RepID=UPI001CCC9A90|nr:type II toxin-antitoxin system RelE/ParE family toxin [Kovacikia minuta]UBF27822.1 type II toxin-antitoxin system RelE/ParE family toxin [Kovacikia minuta CCNUW1]
MTDFSSVEIRFTPKFQRKLRFLAKKYRQIQSDLSKIFVQLKAGDLPGDRLSGIGAEVLKVRIKNSDIKKGKSSGYRIIYWLQTPTCVVLVDIYTKSEQDDVEISEIQSIIAKFEKQSEEGEDEVV